MVTEERNAARLSATRSSVRRPRQVVVKIGSGRDFQSGKIGSPETYSWTSQPKSADWLLLNFLKVLRARSREQECSNDYMMQFLSMVPNHVAGPTGVQMQAQVTKASAKVVKGSVDPEPDIEASRAIEEAFTRWGVSEICDIEGLRSWTDHQRQAIRTIARDGEYLARLIKGRDAGPYGFAIQVLDAELLDVQFNQPLSGGAYIRMGIEFNAWSRPVAYHLFDDDPQASPDISYGYPARKRRRIPADEIIHLFIPLWPGQKRGLPWASTALFRMWQLGGYEGAALMNARAGASKVGAITTPAGEDDAAPGATGIEGEDGEGGRGGGEQYIDVEPGSWFRLAPGEEIKGWSPDYPRGEFPEFVRACLRGIAAGLNVDYSSLSGDLENVNYSSIRAGVLEQREVWKGLQAWFIGSYHRRIYAGWLPMALLSGAIMLGGKPVKYLPEREDAFSRVRWQPRRWPWVDPANDTTANVEALRNGFSSLSEIIRDRGRDPEDVWQEIRRERERLKQLGLDDLAGIRPSPEPVAEMINPPTKETPAAKPAKEGSDDDDDDGQGA